jgi:parallel beta-helix repeat protein
MIRRKSMFALGLIPLAVTVLGSTAHAQRTRRPRTTVTNLPSTTVPVPDAPTTIASTTPTPLTIPVDPTPSTAPPLPVYNDPNTFYVSPDGSNTNPGTKAFPWASPSWAARTLTAGQTVLVSSGTYTDGMYITNSGAPGRPITFKAAPGATPKIEISDPNASGVLVVGAAYIRIQGLDFSYVGPPGPFPTDVGFGDGIVATATADRVPSHHVEIVGNRVHGFNGGGIGGLQADYMLIEGNTVWNNSRWSEYDTSGINLYQTVDHDRSTAFHNIIRANTVFANENRVPDKFSGTITDGNCIIIDDQRRYQTKLPNKTADGPYQSATLIENNICSGNGGRGVHVFNSDNVIARNNTLYQNLRTPGLSGGEMSAVYVIEEADLGKNVPSSRGNVRFVNNIVVSDGVQSTALSANDPDDANNATFDHNFYFGSSAVANLGATDIVGESQPFVSPGVDIFSANFRLNATTRAIDSALPSQAPPLDVSAAIRPRGNGPDMGAWEFIPGGN